MWALRYPLIKMGRTTVYFARVSLLKTVMDYDEKSETRLSNYFSELVREDAVKLIKHPKFDWHFGDVEEDDQFIYFKLGKVQKKGTKTIFDESNRSFIEKEITEENANVSHMLFDKKKHFLLYEERPEVGYKQIRTVVGDAFERQHQRSIRIDNIPNKQDFKRVLEESSRITTAKFTLHPTNPDDSEALKKMDGLLRDIRAKTGKMEFRNEEGGLDKNSSTFKGATSMVEKGFGSEIINYEDKEGKKQKYVSKRKHLKESLDTPRGDAEWKSKLIDMYNKTVDLLYADE